MTASRRVQIVIALAMLVAFLILHQRVLHNFHQDAQLTAAASLFRFGETQSDGVAVSCRVVSLDPITRVMDVRLEVTPLGTYAGPDGTLKGPLKAQFDGVTGHGFYEWKAGSIPTSLEFTASLVGTAAEYPFDHQQGHIEVHFSQEGRPVPVAAGGNAQVNGFKVDLGRTLDPSGKQELAPWGPGFFRLTLEVSRSSTVVNFAIFVVVIQWLMAAGAWLVALEVVIGGRPPDAPMFSWMTAMLFALPPMRSIMVGVPPIGAYVDYLGFLWCEGIIALCLLAVVLAWLVRRPPHPR